MADAITSVSTAQGQGRTPAPKKKGGARPVKFDIGIDEILPSRKAPGNPNIEYLNLEYIDHGDSSDRPIWV